jgi:hypothetical protein
MSTGYITASLDTTRRKYVGSECTVSVTVRNSSGVVTSPTSITFKYRYQSQNRNGGIAGSNEISVSLVNTGTGTYTATFKPERPGVINYRIASTTPTAAYEDNISIADSRFSLTGA